MKRPLFAICILGFAAVVMAQAKPFAAWALRPKQAAGYSVEVWRNANDRQRFAWRLVAPDGNVVAAMPQPVVPPGYVVNHGECRVAGVLRHDVLALVKHRSKVEWSGDIRAVWIASPEAKAFSPRSPAGVVCRNEGYGV